MSWTDMYNINDMQESKYIHSHWENFDYIMKKNIGDVDLLALEIKTKVEENLKDIVFNMIDREINWMKNVEQAFVTKINDYHDENYANIYELMSAFQSALKYVAGRGLIGKAIQLKVNTAEYKKILKSSANKVKTLAKKNGVKLTDPQYNKALNDEVKVRLQSITWLEDFIDAFADLYNMLDNKVLSFLDGVGLPKELDTKTEIMFTKLEGVLKYGIQQKYVGDSKHLKKFLKDYYAADKGNIRHLIDMLSYTNQENLFYGAIDAVQFSSSFGFFYEDVFPSLLEYTQFQSLILPFDPKYKDVSVSMKDINIIDQVLGEISYNDKNVIIGASLKLKADHMTKNSYIVPNIWAGKLTGAKSPEEQEMFNQTVPYKNMINWVKNNISALSSYALDKEKSNAAADAVLNMEKTVGVWSLLTRFLNGFLKELNDDKYSSMAYGSWKEIEPTIYTMFVISNDELFLTSDLLSVIRKGFVETSPGRIKMRSGAGFMGKSRGWEKAGTKDIKDSATQLWKNKELAWSQLDKISYKALMNHPAVMPSLERINLSLSGRAGIAKAYYEIRFDKLK